ncbi:uncharacterized protein LOC143026336 [Oratosquilla oratoria]|uniref:uncharacterized protein LOC143026336 n=1 Tax=Oratosquilla oratoria TaxID=337810 RepID=UPI003F75B1F5
MATQLRIGFIGAGNMASAMAKGFIAAGLARPQDIMASSPPVDQALLDKIQGLGCRVSHHNEEVADHSDVVIVSVKPNVISRVLSDIRHVVTPSRQLLASVALGVPLASLQDHLPSGSRVVRVMPNTPALVQMGATVYCRGTYASKNDGEIINSLFSSVGTCAEVPETFFDAVTGLSGSGPAYAYMAVEALADGGVLMGLPRPLAIALAAQTMMGAARMVLETSKHPGQLKDEVCSPAGCTIQGVMALERSGLRSAFIQAVQASAKKSIEVADSAQALAIQTSKEMETTQVLAAMRSKEVSELQQSLSAQAATLNSKELAELSQSLAVHASAVRAKEFAEST